MLVPRLATWLKKPENALTFPNMPDLIESDTPTIEQCLCNKWGDVKSAVKDRLYDAENYVREEPLQAVAYAAAAGYVLRILPLGAIVRSLVKLSLTAVKPLAFLYGAAKTYEILIGRKKS